MKLKTKLASLLLLLLSSSMIMADSIPLDSLRLSEAVIVSGNDQSTEVKRAINELQEYIQKITSAKITIVAFQEAAKYPDKLKINVGLNPNLKNTPKLEQCTIDGYWLKSLEGNNLLISGKTSVGTEFGVYGFLQDYCGVRWYLPGTIGTFIPVNSGLSIKHLDKLDNPKILSRDLSPIDSSNDPLTSAWRRHNRMLQTLKIGHNLGNIIKVSKYGVTNPEYFSLVKGKRKFPEKDSVGGGYNPCMTNEDVIRICAEAATEYFDGHPNEISFSLGENDGAVYCDCEKCTEANGGPLKTNYLGLTDYSRLVWSFMHKIKNKIPERHKNKKITFYNYMRTQVIPDDMVQDEMLLPVVTSHFSSYNNAEIRESEFKYLNKLTQFAVHEYTCTNMSFAAPLSLFENYLDAVKDKLKGWHSELYPQWSVDSIKAYIIARKTWNPDVRLKDLITDYCKNMFGEGAVAMIKYYELADKTWNDNYREKEGGVVPNWSSQVTNSAPYFMSCKDLEDMVLLLDEAKLKTTNSNGLVLLEKSLKWANIFWNNLVIKKNAEKLALNSNCAEKLYPVTVDTVQRALMVMKGLFEISSTPWDCWQSGGNPLAFTASISVPEAIATPLLMACRKENRMDIWDNFMIELGRINSSMRPELTAEAYLKYRQNISLNIKKFPLYQQTLFFDFYDRIAFMARNFDKIENSANLVPPDVLSKRLSEWGSNAIKKKMIFNEKTHTAYFEGISADNSLYTPTEGFWLDNLALKNGVWYMIKYSFKSSRPHMIQIFSPERQRLFLSGDKDNYLNVIIFFKALNDITKIFVTFTDLGKSEIKDFSIMKVDDNLNPDQMLSNNYFYNNNKKTK